VERHVQALAVNLTRRGHGVTSPISVFSILFGKGLGGSATVLTNHSLLRSVKPNLAVKLLLQPFISRADAIIAVSTCVAEEDVEQGGCGYTERD